MEIDSTVLKVQDNNGQDSETVKSDFIIHSKSTNKLIHTSIKCLAVLVQHVENAISKSNGLVFSNNSSTVKLTDGSNIDIVEHTVIKQEPDDASRHLRSIKKYILQICHLYLNWNIIVTCDLTFQKINFYECVDDSTRSLVINYLTENINYLIQHIGFIISLFKQETDHQEAKDIRKSLQRIYKQILMIPLNSNLDEIPEVYQKLNSSQWYTESMLHLGENLSALRTVLIKLKKIVKKRNVDQAATDKNIEMSSIGRKSDDFTNQPSPKRMKHCESNGVYTPDNVFRIPDIPAVSKSNVITVENDLERKKTKKRKAQSETNGNEIFNDSENKKKKHKYKSEVTSESDTESVKNKRKMNSDIIENINIESDTASIKKKKKRKKNSDIIEKIENDTDSVKKKHKIKSDYDENDSMIASDTESLKIKKKHKQKSMTNGNNTRSDIGEGFVEDADFQRKDRKHKATKNRKLDISRTISESSDGIGKLCISHIDIGDEEMNVTTENSPNKSKTPQQDKPGDITQELGDFLNNYNLKPSKKPKKKKDHDLSHEFFSALSQGQLELDYTDDAENLLQKYIKENNLNENEKYLYLQDLLLDAKKMRKVSEEMKEKLKYLSILVNWDIPEIHEIESRLGSGPNPEEQEKLLRLGVSNKRFHREEDIRIRKNWQEFCKLHDLDENPSPFLMLRPKKQLLKFEERKKFVQFLGKGLNNRALSSIYRRFKILFGNTKSGRFSEEEDDIILTYCKNINNQANRFSSLALLLKRNSTAVENRYRTLTRKFNNGKMKWTLEIETELVRCLLKTIGSTDIQDLKHVKLSSKNYHQVASMMEVPSEKIRHQWLKFIYTKLFAAEQLHIGKIRLKLAEMLIASGETDFTKLDWDEIATHFEGVTKEFLEYHLMVAQTTVAPKLKKRDLGKIVNYFKDYIQNQEAKGKILFSKSIVSRYRMTEEGLECIDNT